MRPNLSFNIHGHNTRQRLFDMTDIKTTTKMGKADYALNWVLNNPTADIYAWIRHATDPATAKLHEATAYTEEQCPSAYYWAYRTLNEANGGKGWEIWSRLPKNSGKKAKKVELPKLSRAELIEKMEAEKSAKEGPIGPQLPEQPKPEVKPEVKVEAKPEVKAQVKKVA
jgi:hypothetical protein